MSDVTALVFDHGLFIPLAQRLAQKFKRVLYYSPYESGFTTLNKAIIGDGFREIEWCEDFWKIKKEIDLFVFPDIQHSGLQLELESQGFPVWGSRNGDSLELNRQKFHAVLRDLGLNCAKFEVVRGVPALREYLRDKENKYIKISKFRGSLETTHWRSWEEDEGMLDLLGVRFGPARVPFLVFDAIETDIELGGDTYGIDGQWPELMLQGYEHKDKGYLGSVRRRQEMPDQLKDVLDGFGPVLAPERYRNFWSMELRVKGDESTFIDPCCRGPLPGLGSQLNLWTNLPEIVWHGAHGELIEPEPAAEFAAECVLTMKVNKEEWGKVRIIEELGDWAKYSNCCQIGGMVCFPPDNSHGEEIGWLGAVGGTMRETIERLKAHAELLPDGVTAHLDSLVALLKEIHEAERQGIEFTSQTVPEPEMVIAEKD